MFCFHRLECPQLEVVYPGDPSGRSHELKASVLGGSGARLQGNPILIIEALILAWVHARSKDVMNLPAPPEPRKTSLFRVPYDDNIFELRVHASYSQFKHQAPTFMPYGINYCGVLDVSMSERSILAIQYKDSFSGDTMICSFSKPPTPNPYRTLRDPL